MGASAMFAETLIQGHWLQSSERLQLAHQRTWSDEFSRCERSGDERWTDVSVKDRRVLYSGRWRPVGKIPPVAGRSPSPSPHVDARRRTSLARRGASFATSSLAGYATSSSCTAISNSIPSLYKIIQYTHLFLQVVELFLQHQLAFLVYYVRQSTSSMIIFVHGRGRKWTWGGSIAAQYSRRRLLVIREVWTVKLFGCAIVYSGTTGLCLNDSAGSCQVTAGEYIVRPCFFHDREKAASWITQGL